MSGLDFSTAAGIDGPVSGGESPPDGVDPAGAGARIADPAAATSVDEDLDKSLRPKRLSEFVGQRRVREQLSVFIEAALQREEALDHALFAGPPGLGKCVTPDTVLFTTHGMVPIGSLGDLDGENWQPITRPVAGLYGLKIADYFYNNGEGKTVRITTRAGYSIEGTPNHPLLIRDAYGQMQFRRMSELEHGDEVAVRIGAQIFGSSTRLTLEGMRPPRLDDPARLPDELTPSFSRLVGMLLTRARLAVDVDAVVVRTETSAVAREIMQLSHEVFCADVAAPVGSGQDSGAGTATPQIRFTSPRVAELLQALGLTQQGFLQIPAPFYRAPRLVVAELLRGVFWGVEERPSCRSGSRPLAAHLQLMLANFGIESHIRRLERGYELRVSSEPARYDEADVTTRPGEVSAEAIDALEQEISDAEHLPVQGGFGFAAAGSSLLDLLPAHRLGNHYSHHQERHTAGEHHAAARDARVGQRVSVAEVDPNERSRALMRDRTVASDLRALAVRSVTSELRPKEVVELVWEPVEDIQAGYAHTCDVSVPDGHTFIGNGIICHNTTLASVVANELGSTMHQTSGPALDKKADVAAILTSLQPRDVLFIDEIHRLNTTVEEVLYSAMEEYQIDIVLGQGPAARTLRLDVEPFTLVGATTRTGLLTTPLRDRFGFIQRLEYYDTDELRQIVERSASLLGISIVEEAADEIACRSRGTPRIANRLLKRVRDVAQVRHSGAISIDVAKEALELVDIDEAGLDRTDRAILETIYARFAGGPVGLSTLSVAIGEEPHTLEDVYEPYLLQRGLIQRTPRGRIITELGRQHLGAPPPAGAVVGPLFRDE